MIKRNILSSIRQHLSQKEITLIVGPRQAGKTTIIKQLKKELDQKGENTLLLNLDIESEFALFETQEKLLHSISRLIGNENGFVFIDEYQRKENGGKFIKGLYDMDLPYKFVITGSGSIELKESVHESLAGRKRVFEVTTLSFQEYFNYKTEYHFEDRESDYAEVFPEKIDKFLLDYLVFGGYPRLALVGSIEEKQKLIEEIYHSYLIRDISALLKVEKTTAFKKLLELISIQNGKLINISTLSNDTGLAIQTVEKYLWYLEKTYILDPVRPYFKNSRNEIKKAHTYYFLDLGLQNLIAGGLINPSNKRNLGFEFQNFVYLQLKKSLLLQGPTSVHYWRTKAGAEVDFVIKRGEMLIGVECKYKKMDTVSISRSMRAFIDKYQPANVFIINRSFENETMLNNTQINFLPYYLIDRIIGDG